MKQLRGIWIAIGLSLTGIAMAQSSTNFRVVGGRATSASQETTPISTNFRVDGSVNVDSASGIATSMNFQASSGVPTPPEVVFRNGFEN